MRVAMDLLGWFSQLGNMLNSIKWLVLGFRYYYVRVLELNVVMNLCCILY